MKAFLYLALATALFCCAKPDLHDTRNADEVDQVLGINAIVVLPVDVQPPAAADSATLKNLEAGADTLARLMINYFADSSEVTVISRDQKEAETADFKGGELEVTREIGRKMRGDAVMTSTVERFREREGDSYSINAPASVSFKYRLIHTDSGRIICSGTFDETQKSLLEDIFSFSKAASRGFKWITAEQLTREGVETKFADCPYLEGR